MKAAVRQFAGGGGNTDVVFRLSSPAFPGPVGLTCAGLHGPASRGEVTHAGQRTRSHGRWPEILPGVPAVAAAANDAGRHGRAPTDGLVEPLPPAGACHRLAGRRQALGEFGSTYPAEPHAGVPNPACVPGRPPT